MKEPILLLQMLTIYFCKNVISKEFEFPTNEKRSRKGKEIYEQFGEESKYKNSKCWRLALQKIDESCRKMSDIHQSFLALQFANCHLERSGLGIYSCTLDNFRECTNKMSPVAFNTYTQFFGQVSDICFYFQTEIWRDRTEETITKLSRTSKESLDVLSKSVQQQKEVLSAQEQSLKNQKDIIQNENLLKESLLHSAQSAKDVFLEVKEHAQQQKTMFSETFDNIFKSVENLANLQKMLLGEFIGLQSLTFYFVATIVCYLFTSTPQTSRARLALFVALTLLIVSERVFVGRTVDNGNQPISSEIIHERIWVLRKIFLAVATMILGVFTFRYKDFNKINYGMLQEIQLQVTELRKIQQTASSALNNLDEIDGSSLENTVIEVTKPRGRHPSESDKLLAKLEMTINSFVTSTPHKENLSFFNKTSNLDDTVVLKPSSAKSKKKSNSRLAEFSDEDVLNRTAVVNARSKRERRKSRLQNPTDESLNGSRYNLRKRRISTNGSLGNLTPVK